MYMYACVLLELAVCCLQAICRTVAVERIFKGLLKTDKQYSILSEEKRSFDVYVQNIKSDKAQRQQMKVQCTVSKTNRQRCYGTRGVISAIVSLSLLSKEQLGHLCLAQDYFDRQLKGSRTEPLLHMLLQY